MWDCEKCGCMNIAGSIDVCPMCQESRPEGEKDVAVEPRQPAEDSTSAPAGSQPESGPPPSGDASAAAPSPRKSSKGQSTSDEKWGED